MLGRECMRCSYLRPHCNRSKRSFAGSLRFRPRLLDFLGRLGFCYLLIRGYLRFLVSSFGICLATAGLAMSALSVVFTDARTTTLLAIIAYSVVLAYARPTTLLALIAYSVVLAYACTTALLAP